MRKSVALFAVLILITAKGFALPSENQRRIEEEKRRQLRISETRDLQSPQEEILSHEKTEEFFQSLFRRQKVTVNDLFRTITVLLGISEDYPDFESQESLLLERGWLPAPLAGQANRDVLPTRGQAAYVFSSALGIKGGVMLRVFGMSQRYALKELIYLGISPGGGKHETISGRELLYMFVQSVDYLSQQKR